MKIRFSRKATSQIESALNYVAVRSPAGALKVRDRLRALTALLGDHPLLGQVTDRPGVRRLLISPYPYLIDYRVVASEIIVLRFCHAARRPE